MTYKNPFVNTISSTIENIFTTLATAVGVSGKLAMVTVCTQILAYNTSFHSGASALAVTNLCFADTPTAIADAIPHLSYQSSQVLTDRDF